MDLDVLHDYQISKQIGEGSFASVYLAHHKITGTNVAIKVVPKYFNNKLKLQQIHQEIEIFKRVHHPFICRFYEALENNEFFFIVMENLFDGSLLSYANKNGPMKEEDAAVIFSELIIALRYLHEECSIVHRDIKAENILLDENHNIRLIDFGISRIHDMDTEFMKTNCGSILYAAPEIISDHGYTKSVDIWSAGILLYAIVVGHFPFEENNYKKLTHRIVYSNVEYPPCLSILLTDLLQKMLVKDPSQRITIKEILDHPWVKRYVVNIENILNSTKFDEKEMESQYEKYPTVNKELLRNIVERRFYTNAIHSIRFNPHGFKPKYRSLPQIVFTDRNPITPVIPYASKIRIPSNIKKRVIIQPHITLPNVQ